MPASEGGNPLRPYRQAPGTSVADPWYNNVQFYDELGKEVVRDTEAVETGLLLFTGAELLAPLVDSLLPAVDSLLPAVAGVGAAETSDAAEGVEAAGRPFAMGLTDEGLEQFAAERGATTWKDLPDPGNWKSGVVEKLADPNTPVHFNLDGVNAWQGVSRAAAGRGGPTDWELLTIQQNPQWWGSIQFWENGTPVANPFQ